MKIGKTRFILFCTLVVLVTLFLGSCKEPVVDYQESQSPIKFLIEQGHEHPRTSTLTEDGGVVFAGGVDLNSYMLSVDGSGEKEWSKRFGYGGSSFFLNIIQVKNGDLIGVGYTKSRDLGAIGKDRSAYMARVSRDGQLLWEKAFYDDGPSAFESVVEDEDGSLVAVGFVVPASSNSLIYKLDQNGETIWKKSFAVGPWLDECKSVVITPQGNYRIFGVCSPNGFVTEIRNYRDYTMELEAVNGVKTFEYIFEHDRRGYYQGSSELRMDLLNADGNFVMVSTWTDPSENYYIHFMNVAPDGTINYEEYIEGEGTVDLKEIKEVEGGYLLVGASNRLGRESVADGTQKVLSSLTMIDKTGKKIWTSEVGGNARNQMAFSVKKTEDGWWISGISVDPEGGDTKYLFYQIGETGTLKENI